MAEIVELACLLLLTVGPAREYLCRRLLDLVADSGYTVEELFPNRIDGGEGGASGSGSGPR